jgi:hypothetical protein
MTDGARTPSRSRRSYPNLHNLSLAPLSAKYPLDASAPPSPDEHVRTPGTSYIAMKSAPTTPGILSLSQSRSNSRHRAKKAYAYDTYFVNTDSAIRDVGDIPKAKSTSTLQPGVSFADQTATPEAKAERHHTRKRTAPLPLRSPLIRHHTTDANDEWFHRAGLAIAGETRDSKGQGWLVRRESSTSLVGQSDEYVQHPSHDTRHMALLSGEHFSEDIDVPTFFSPRISRAGSRITSRVGSRVPSARQSRRGSRVGSRVDLLMSVGSKPQSGRQSLEGTDIDDRFIEPDFVEADEESDGDEETVARLARERNSGLGGWMDRLIGWTLFSVDEDIESSDDEEKSDPSSPLRLDNLTKEELRLRREVEAKRRKMEREAIVAASAVNSQDAKKTDDESSRPSTADIQHPEEMGGWQDAAWLLSVASKALLS